LLFSIISTPGLAIALQVLGGVSFATYIVGGVTYVNERAPQGLSTTAQAVFSLVTFGAGWVAGSLIAGSVYETAGIVWLFRLLTVIALAGFALFLLSRRLIPTPQESPVPG
jgi:PPP family 3-phenylpropionic acid transporter